MDAIFQPIGNGDTPQIRLLRNNAEYKGVITPMKA